jgi:alpha,alpha-trehalase
MFMLIDLLHKNKLNWPETKKIQNACDYIKGYWGILLRENKKTTETLMGLPNHYIVPANQHGDFRFNEQYYWDSYFIASGLIIDGHGKLAEDMLDNLFYMFKKLHMVPSASRLYMTSRSQPPLLTSYILMIYKNNKKNLDWLKTAYKLAEEEYLNVWRGQTHPNWREVYKGLSRYYDTNVLHDLAEAESGWDMTPRFSRRALDFLPIDLNCMLYKYELDFAKMSDLLNDPDSAVMWQQRAQARKEMVNKLMWNHLKNFYFDYNYLEEKQGQVWSLAAYYALWSGLADEEKAHHLVKQLHKFDCDYGLSATNKILVDFDVFGSVKTQWAYPNGWAPLHYIVIEGLERYGYKKEAEDVAKKWLNTNLNWFENHGQFIEKYNVVDCTKKPAKGVYPTQIGFGWTNGVFLHLVDKYGLLKKSKKSRRRS